MLRPFLALSLLILSAWSLPDFAAMLAAGLGVMPLAFFWAGCPCCNTNCVQFTDSFTRADSTSLGSDWTEVAGDWQIVSNRLQAPGSNALATCNTAASDTANYQVHVSFNTSSVTTGDRLRLIFNYTDTSNYHYLELTVGTSLKLVRKSGGADTTLATQTFVTTLLDRLHACSDAGTVRCYAGQSTSTFVAFVVDDTISSGTCGVATGPGIAATPEFDDFSIETPSTSTCIDCFACGNTATGCTIDHNSQMQVDISGTSFTAGDTCSSPTCASLDGTYVCDFAGFYNEINVVDCHWLYELPSAICQYKFVVVSLALFEKWDVELRSAKRLPTYRVNYTFTEDCAGTPTPSGITNSGVIDGSGQCTHNIGDATLTQI